MPLDYVDEVTIPSPAPEEDYLRPAYNRRGLLRETEDGLNLSRTFAGESGSPQAFQAAFDFLQRNANGRYSDRSLMAISRWGFYSSEMLDGERRSPSPTPCVFSLSREVTYDEDTEVKTGGTVAMAVTLPGGESGSKLIIATAPDARRRGYASRLLTAAQVIPYLHAWVGQMNIVGQQFLLATGMHPIAMNRRQALMYAYDEMPEDEGVAQ